MESNKISKEEVIDKMISVLGYGISLRAVLDICYETGADAGAEEAAGCGRRDIRKAFQERIDVIMQSRRLADLKRSCWDAKPRSDQKVTAETQITKPPLVILQRKRGMW